MRLAFRSGPAARRASGDDHVVALATLARSRKMRLGFVDVDRRHALSLD
jgi:hypothetical protein